MTETEDNTEKQFEIDESLPTKTPKFRESDAGDGTRREDHLLTGLRFYICVISLILCMFLVALDQMVTTAVLTVIADQFHEFNKITWITAAFLMPMGCCAQVWGRLSISFGRKWIMISGMLLFEVGSLITGVSNSMNMFIGGRAIQGIGASCIQTCVMVIANEITTIDKKPILISCLGLTFVVASVAGPAIGGALGTYSSWRWCFYLNLCCGAIIFPFFMFTYNPKPPIGSFKEKLQTVDFIDSGLMISTFVLLLLGISFGQTEASWKTASVICCFTLGGLTLIAFLIFNFKYSENPVIPANIVKKPAIVVSFFAFAFNYSVLVVMMQFTSIYFQNVLGNTAFHTGISLIPVAVATSLVAIANGILMRKTRLIKELCVAGSIILPISVGLMLLLNVEKNVGNYIGFQILLGAATGMNFQGPMISALIAAPKDPGSTILTTSLFNFGRSTGSALFSLIAGAIYTETLKSHIRNVGPQLQEHQIPLLDIIVRTDLIQELSSHDKKLVLTAIMESIHDVFWLALAIAITALLFSIFMSNKKLPKSEEVEA
ncbi:DEKNAAC104782 [Brettanomyces naardenensis]|uniref:DEKNAAC104782 n=1 Tax=Brettanomyces naardenensis TaxID=13370 RepID=A0A448YRU9_BRENA|nr:DEKNAAC104782 [Brettanomyces naardenensis]